MQTFFILLFLFVFFCVMFYIGATPVLNTRDQGFYKFYYTDILSGKRKCVRVRKFFK